MLRGEIRVTDFDPAHGSEVAKRRPAIVVSNDGANARVVSLGQGVITVVPLTSNVASVHLFQVELPAAETGLRAESKAQAEQVRSISFDRIGRRVGAVPQPLMAQVDDALRLHLTL
ncbi:MAG: type II toxin-antitoxin system PemK/MazF family toxin [Solirubrobacteraceae bacterium]